MYYLNVQVSNHSSLIFLSSPWLLSPTPTHTDASNAPSMQATHSNELRMQQLGTHAPSGIVFASLGRSCAVKLSGIGSYTVGDEAVRGLGAFEVGAMASTAHLWVAGHVASGLLYGMG